MARVDYEEAMALYKLDHPEFKEEGEEACEDVKLKEAYEYEIVDVNFGKRTETDT
jgi:hypothetical protein